MKLHLFIFLFYLQHTSLIQIQTWEASVGHELTSPVWYTNSFAEEKRRLIIKKSPPNRAANENTWQPQMKAVVPSFWSCTEPCQQNHKKFCSFQSGIKVWTNRIWTTVTHFILIWFFPGFFLRRKSKVFFQSPYLYWNLGKCLSFILSFPIALSYSSIIYWQCRVSAWDNAFTE